MKKKLLGITLIALTAALAAAGCSTKTDDGEKVKDPFDYEGNYAAPELTIDGKGDDAQWQATEVLATFGRGTNAATIKAYRGENALFFLVEVSDTVLLTEGNANDDSVTRSDSIELFLDTKADGGLHPQNDDFQINLGIHGKTRIMQGAGNQWGNWNGLIDYEVWLDGTLNDGTEADDRGYSVEVMIPYSQIGIQKDDTVGVSFGQVDKTGSGNAAEVDWNWYGWEYGGRLREPQTIDNYVLLDKDNNLIDRNEESKPDAEVAGYVIDSATKQPVSGATVSATSGASAETDEKGYYTLGKVSSNSAYTVTVEKSGYLKQTVTYSREELRAANGGRVTKEILVVSEDSLPKTTLAGTVKNLLDGEIAGATVAVEGMEEYNASTGEDGSFEIVNFPVNGSVTLVVSKEGYGESRTLVSKNSLTQNGTTQLGDVSLNRPYTTGTFAGGEGKQGDNRNKFANSTIEISRALNGIEMYFSGTRRLSGKVEVYLDTKECGDHRDNDETCWRFDLNDDGTVLAVKTKGGTAVSSSGLEYALYQNGDDGYRARFFIPYTYLNIGSKETFGISLGQWSTSANDWDGWNSMSPFPASEHPAEYVRVSANGEFYRDDENLQEAVKLFGNAGMGGVNVSAGGGSAVTDENGDWVLWVSSSSATGEVVYGKQGYVSRTSAIGASGWLSSSEWKDENVTLAEKRLTLTGSVTDRVTGEPISGVTVTVTGDGVNWETTTNESGEYTIANVTAFVALTVTFTAQDYITGEIDLTAERLNRAEGTLTLDKDLASALEIVYVTAKGNAVDVGGALEGATVRVDGETRQVTTGENGSFEIENFAGRDCTLVIEKTGYYPVEIAFKADRLEANDDEYDFGEIFLMLEYAPLGGIIANKSDDFAGFTGYVTRSQTGFEFKFTGTKAFVGHFELFVDTGSSAGDFKRDASDYRFNLGADGTVTIVNWNGGSETSVNPVPENMKYSVNGAGTAPELLFTLPYSFLGVAATDIVGISAGQWSTSAKDWDGWTHDKITGANGELFVKPEMPQDYIRLGVRNEVFENVCNSTDILDLAQYDLHFGIENDVFYARVKNRDANGVTFEFVTLGDFGKNESSNEMVLLYFDTGDTNDGWDNVDYLLKIDSAGNVYGKGGSAIAWWVASDENKTGNVTISRENNRTAFEVTVAYTTLGIGAQDVFGICMREARAYSAERDGDFNDILYDPWHDCYFGAVDTANQIDAANSSQYVRVAADGTLYKAANNG